MGQWFLQWGWAVAILIFTMSIVAMLYRSSVAAWTQSRGDWKVATWMEVGPFLTFALKVAVGALVFTWAIGYAHSTLTRSPVAMTVRELSSAGASALAGTFTDINIEVPEAPSLTEFVASNIPTESDVRGLLGVPDVRSAAPAAEAAPAAVESNGWVAPQAAPPAAVESKNLGAWSPSSIINTNGNWGNPAVFGPQPQPTQGPAPRPTATPAPVQGPQPQPTAASGWNVTFGGGSGGPMAAAADAAVTGTYTVKRGDDLSKISVAVYGNKHGWSSICNANRDKLRDCNILRVGTVLVIPEVGK